MTTSSPISRTYRASIASVVEPYGRRTIVMPPGSHMVSTALPLTAVEITVRGDEVFMASNGKGETRYCFDLQSALNFARDSGSEGMADSVVILSPSKGVNGINEFAVVRIHERAGAESFGCTEGTLEVCEESGVVSTGLSFGLADFSQYDEDAAVRYVGSYLFAITLSSWVGQ